MSSDQTYPFFPQKDALDLLRAALDPDHQRAHQAWLRWRQLHTLQACDIKMNRLMPLIYRRFQQGGLDPDDHRILRGVYRYNWTRNQLALRQARTVSLQLQAAGIQVLLLKGLPLILDYYRDLGVRPMWDFDLLVHPERQREALELLSRLDWHNHEPCHEVWIGHACGLQGPGNISLDLHWFVMHSSRWEGADDDFWERSEKLSLREPGKELGGPVVRALCPEHQLIHVCIHGARFDSNQDLGWVSDAYHILTNRELDWELVLESAKRHRVVSALHLALSYLCDKLHAPVPEAVMVRLGAAPKTWSDRLYFHLAVKGGPLNFWLMPVLDYLRWQPQPTLLNFLEYLRQRWFLARTFHIPFSAAQRIAMRAVKWAQNRISADSKPSR